MPINSAYRVNLFFTSSTFWEFVSARIMNSNFKTVKYTADWKEKTDLLFLDKGQKNRILKVKIPRKNCA